jgi:methylmalonyl-CoA mutase
MASSVKGIALAGRPGESEREWRAAGVDDFIFAGGDAVATLQSLYRRITVDMAAAATVTS